MPITQISLDDVNIILGHNHYTTISMNDADVRDLAEIPSGEIGMVHLAGKPKYSYDRDYSPVCYWDAIQFSGSPDGSVTIKYNDEFIVFDAVGYGYADAISYTLGSYKYLRGGLMYTGIIGEDTLKFYSVARYLI